MADLFTLTFRSDKISRSGQLYSISFLMNRKFLKSWIYHLLMLYGQIIALFSYKTHSSFHKRIVGIWWLVSAWEIEIDQICAYKIPLVNVFLGARFRWKGFFFNQIVIHVSFRQGNWNQQNAWSQRLRKIGLSVQMEVAWSRRVCKSRKLQTRAWKWKLKWSRSVMSNTLQPHGL